MSPIYTLVAVEVSDPRLAQNKGELRHQATMDRKVVWPMARTSRRRSCRNRVSQAKPWYWRPEHSFAKGAGCPELTNDRRPGLYEICLIPPNQKKVGW